jgi:hydroxymethylpyrimidine/phosphomethylpyrimidine kinase
MVPIALTIAGSDPSGGAGLQADLKTFHRFGVYGEAVVTLITVQNTCGVRRVETLDPQLVNEQLQAVLEDIPPKAAKTGALGSREIVEAIAAAAGRFDFPLVVDPVMISKHGAPLLPGDAVRVLIDELIPRAYLLTPNLDEASALAGFPVNDPESMRRAGEKILGYGVKNVLVKGGHLRGDAVDILVNCSKETIEFQSPRVATQHTHGSGCTYSAAITAELSKGAALGDAVRSAKSFIDKAISTNPGLGRGQGPLNHFA